jgi:CheY-like chemotaxis protein
MNGEIDTDTEGMVVLVLDSDGTRSAIAEAVRRLGHRVVTTTGLETAVMVLGSLVPDLVLVRSIDEATDTRAVARLTNASPATPVRAVTSSLTLQDLSQPAN